MGFEGFFGGALFDILVGSFKILIALLILILSIFSISGDKLKIVVTLFKDQSWGLLFSNQDFADLTFIFVVAIFLDHPRNFKITENFLRSRSHFSLMIFMIPAIFS